jgi:DNA invertase Pin-like site-specific DNA recombinase
MPSRRENRKRTRIYAPLTQPGPGAMYGVYARFSDEDLQSGDSIKTQLHAAHIIGESREWHLYDDYVDDGISAKYDAIERRPRFEALLRDIAAGKIQAVLCNRIDRWARNQSIFHATLKRLVDHRIWWETTQSRRTINDYIDPSGKIIISLEASMAESYLASLSINTQDGIDGRAMEGYHTGLPPFGYHVVYPPRPEGAPANWVAPRTPMEPHPREWGGILLTGQLASTYWSAHQIAQALNEQGYRTKGKASGPRNRRTGERPKTGPRLFTKDSVQAILNNPTYRAFSPTSDRGTIITPSGEHIEGRHIAAWDWELCQQIDRARATLRNYAYRTTETVREHYPFAGTLVCASCGEVMRAWHVRKQDATFRYYKCYSYQKGIICHAPNKSLSASMVNEAFGQWLTCYRLGDTWRSDLQAFLSEDHHGNTPINVNEQKKAIAKRRRMLNIQLEAETIGEEEFRREAARLRNEEEALSLLQPDASLHAAALEAGNMIAAIPEIWEAARSHDDQDGMSDLIHAIFTDGGLVWHRSGNQNIIIGCRVYPECLPAFEMTLASVGWYRHGVWLWNSQFGIPDWMA